MASTPYGLVVDRADGAWMSPEMAEQLKEKTGSRFVICDPGEIELE